MKVLTRATPRQGPCARHAARFRPLSGMKVLTPVQVSITYDNLYYEFPSPLGDEGPNTDANRLAHPRHIWGFRPLSGMKVLTLRRSSSTMLFLHGRFRPLSGMKVLTP